MLMIIYQKLGLKYNNKISITFQYLIENTEIDINYKNQNVNNIN